MKLVEKLELLKDMVQGAIDKGAVTVEEVHGAIAAIPFEILERQGLMDADLAEEAYERHIKTVGSVYDAIRDVNKIVGEMASDIFERLEDSEHIARTMNERDNQKDNQKGNQRDNEKDNE